MYWKNAVRRILRFAVVNRCGSSFTLYSVNNKLDYKDADCRMGTVPELKDTV
jgi:hypothetical protein